jgi:beta-phosphoglucomutase
MLRAIIFDFNGVILLDEPYHFRAMSETMADYGVHISEQEYYRDYLPLDDHGALRAICRAHDLKLTESQRTEILTRKPRIYDRLMDNRYPFAEGVAGFVREAAGRFPLALASAATRREVHSALQAAEILGCFRALITAEDFEIGKPSPESYLFALRKLNECLRSDDPVLPDECMVIEDSIGGVQGVRAAGMKCLGVSGTYPREELQAAHHIVGSLREISLDNLDRYFEGTE